ADVGSGDGACGAGSEIELGAAVAIVFGTASPLIVLGTDGAGAWTGATATGAGAGAAGAAAGAAVAAAGVAVSSFVESVTSLAALRNSRMLLPSDAPTSGSLPGPTTMSAMIRTMMSSPGP